MRRRAGPLFVALPVIMAIAGCSTNVDGSPTASNGHRRVSGPSSPHIKRTSARRGHPDLRANAAADVNAVVAWLSKCDAVPAAAVLSLYNSSPYGSNDRATSISVALTHPDAASPISAACAYEASGTSANPVFGVQWATDPTKISGLKEPSGSDVQTLPTPTGFERAYLSSGGLFMYNTSLFVSMGSGYFR